MINRATLRFKLLYAQNWNIGFCKQFPEALISSKSLERIQWLKHPYRDRWFADPFIYKVTDDEIIVFVEECPIENPKGIICELVIDRRTMRLKERYVLLELDTHLSYPAIIREEGKVYVYPENGFSGKLNIYEYDEAKHCLANPICILDEAVADASIIKTGGKYLLICTHYPDTQEKAYIYESASLFGPFKKISDNPFQTLLSCSRPGGNWIEVGKELYRPAQNCEIRYGGSLSIMKCKPVETVIVEEVCFEIQPVSRRYNLGIHTLNFYQDTCVIDGYGYSHPLFAKTYLPISTYIRKLLKNG